METYCSEVADPVNKKINNKTEIWWTISEIQKSNKDLQSLVLLYVPRQCNAIAHSLAKRALKSLDTVIWLSEYPADVLSLFSKPVEWKVSFSYKKKNRVYAIIPSTNIERKLFNNLTFATKDKIDITHAKVTQSNVSNCQQITLMYLHLLPQIDGYNNEKLSHIFRLKF